MGKKNSSDSSHQSLSIAFHTKLLFIHAFFSTETKGCFEEFLEFCAYISVGFAARQPGSGEFGKVRENAVSARVMM